VRRSQQLHSGRRQLQRERIHLLDSPCQAPCPSGAWPEAVAQLLSRALGIKTSTSAVVLWLPLDRSGGQRQRVTSKRRRSCASEKIGIRCCLQLGRQSARLAVSEAYCCVTSGPARRGMESRGADVAPQKNDPVEQNFHCSGLPLVNLKFFDGQYMQLMGMLLHNLFNFSPVRLPPRCVFYLSKT